MSKNINKYVLIILAIIIVLAAALIFVKHLETKDDSKSISKVGITQDNPEATIILTSGDQEFEMVFELYPDKAPETVNNFISLANSGFYNGLTMHRLDPNFVIQGGDPNGDGTGGPGYSITGEFKNNGFDDNDLSHETGVISMARSALPNSAGSQFFIMLEDNQASCDGKYAAFGKIIKGEENLEKIKALPVKEGTETPETTIKIKSINVDTKGVSYKEPTKIV